MIIIKIFIKLLKVRSGKVDTFFFFCAHESSAHESSDSKKLFFWMGLNKTNG
jgi:hypothetical protein